MNRNKYNHKNLEGPDACIETSLKEYGIAWIKGKDETLFYFAIDYGETCSRFDFVALPNDLDVFEEYDWADFDALGKYIGEHFEKMDLISQISALVNYYGEQNIFGETYYEGLIYPQVISGGPIRLKDIEDLGTYFSAEEIAKFAEPFDEIQNIRVINKFYRAQDESDLWPVNNDFNVTDRAIRRVKRTKVALYGLEYCYTIEAEISDIVNH